MPPTPEQSSAGYRVLWDRAKVRPENAAAVKTVAQKIIANKSKYVAVERQTGVPWFMIGPIHNREASLRFNAHLHCGDPLTARTYHVPAGRPKTGSPPFTWEESAVDALEMPPHSLDRVKAWSVERILYETEKYNGWGYLGKTNSPYLWAATSAYGDKPGETGGDGVHDGGGKYVADHVFDRTAIDRQLGCVALLKTLAELDPSVADRLRRREAAAPRDVIEEQVRNQTRTERTVRNAGAGTATIASGAKATVEAPKPAEAPTASVAHGYLLPIAIVLGVVVAAVAITAIARKKKSVPLAVAAKWSGPADLALPATKPA